MDACTGTPKAVIDATAITDMAPAIERGYNLVRQRIPVSTGDRAPGPDVETLMKLLDEEGFTALLAQNADDGGLAYRC